MRVLLINPLTCKVSCFNFESTAVEFLSIRLHLRLVFQLECHNKYGSLAQVVECEVPRTDEVPGSTPKGVFSNL